MASEVFNQQSGTDGVSEHEQLKRIQDASKSAAMTDNVSSYNYGLETYDNGPRNTNFYRLTID